MKFSKLVKTLNALFNSGQRHKRRQREELAAALIKLKHKQHELMTLGAKAKKKGSIELNAFYANELFALLSQEELIQSTKSARAIGEMCGVSVPLHSAEHMYIVTGKIEGVRPDLPVMRDPDGYIYVKEEVGGLAIGGFEPDAKCRVGLSGPRKPVFTQPVACFAIFGIDQRHGFTIAEIAGPKGICDRAEVAVGQTHNQF